MFARDTCVEARPPGGGADDAIAGNDPPTLGVFTGLVVCTLSLLEHVDNCNGIEKRDQEIREPCCDDSDVSAASMLLRHGSLRARNQ